MRAVRNILKVIASNITTIISGVVVSFFLPKIISVSDYGFYKIFTLYFNYLGVLSIGIIDGIVLKYGDKEYDQLKKERFRSYFAWYSILHFILTFVIALTVVVFNDVDYQFVILMLAANLYPTNVTGYFQQISQITQRFNEYSMRRILHSVSNIALIVLMFCLYRSEAVQVTYKLYLYGLLLINIVLTAWYFYTYRDIVFGKRDKLAVVIKDVIELVKIGFPLLLANLSSTLLLSLDRQFVSVFFSTEEYALYAFAYSMLSLITVATSAVAIVIYPFFKRMEKNILSGYYPIIKAVLFVLIYLIMVIYFPLVYFIDFFLPQYAYAVGIFKLILPGLAISSAITVVMHNYYKVFDKSSEFFRKSVVALFVSLVMNVIAYVLFHSREAISGASIIALFAWYFHTECGLRKISNIDIKGTIYMLMMTGAFYFFASIETYWVGGIGYLLFWGIISIIVYKQFFKDIKVLVCKTNG